MQDARGLEAGNAKPQGIVEERRIAIGRDDRIAELSNWSKQIIWCEKERQGKIPAWDELSFGFLSLFTRLKLLYPDVGCKLFRG